MTIIATIVAVLIFSKSHHFIDDCLKNAHASARRRLPLCVAVPTREGGGTRGGTGRDSTGLPGLALPPHGCRGARRRQGRRAGGCARGQRRRREAVGADVVR